MHVQHLVAPKFDAHLPDGLEKRQRFDVAHRAADLHHAYVRISRAHTDAVFDFIRDVRNDLHRRTQIIAAPLFCNHALVNSARRKIAVAPGRGPHETLIMAEIQIGLRAVRGDENLPMLKRTHGAGIDVDVGIQLHHADLEAAGLENGTERCRGDALTERGNHAAGDENESIHSESPPI